MTARGKRLLLVVGIGRSGTSVFTGILGQIGWQVPQPEVQADDTNPRGFGEPRWVVDFHTRLQRACRVPNMDARPAAFATTSAVVDDPAVLAELQRWLTVQFEHADNVVVKDPRIVWFLSLWQRCAEQLQVDTSFATMLRYPTEVLTSARKWYGTWQPDASRAASWLNVMLNTEQLTRGAARAFIRYDDLLASWDTQVSRVAAPLQAEWMVAAAEKQRAAIDSFVDPSLRRSQVGWNDVDVPERVRDMIDVVWEQLSGLAIPGGENTDAYRKLDASRDLYSRFYTETEATAHSSIHAARRRGGGTAAKQPTTSQRLARRVPRPVRRMVPVSLRRRLTRSR